MSSALNHTVSVTFANASAIAEKKPALRAQPRKRPAPFSLRLSDAEKRQLMTDANGQPLGAYIRTQLLGRKAEKRQGGHKLIKDYEKLAIVLAALGRSHLSSNLNQLAKAANIGTLPLTLEVSQELLEACQQIREMREVLIAALGIKPEDGE